MMTFNKYKSYKIFLDVNGVTLVYKCTVIASDELFLTFIDDRRKKYTYNIKCILSFTELDYDVLTKDEVDKYD